MISPFLDFKENPILTPGSGFESKAVYNPAVIVDGGEFHMLYRAEGGDPCTGRIGYACSKDGIHFTRHPDPVIVPEHGYEACGCEDPRLVKIEGTYYLTYVGNRGGHETVNICLATSKDLIHWEKHGAILMLPKDWARGQMKAGVILPERINERYVMYFMGEKEPWKPAIGLAYSDDLINWDEPLSEPVLLPRKGYFDSKGVEPGTNPLVTEEGIFMVYSGWGEDCVYKPGGVVFSKDDPGKLLQRMDKPLFEPAQDWGEKFGSPNHVVAESLVKHGGSWLLYYGAADRACCLAIWEEG